MSVHAPIARERRADTLGAAGEGVAVKEGEIRGDEIRTFRHSNGQLRCEMMLVCGNQGKQIVPKIRRIIKMYYSLTRFPCNGLPWSCTADSVGSARSVCDEGLAERLEDAKELTGQSWQIVDDQGQSPGRRALQLVRSH